MSSSSKYTKKENEGFAPDPAPSSSSGEMVTAKKRRSPDDDDNVVDLSDDDDTGSSPSKRQREDAAVKNDQKEEHLKDLEKLDDADEVADTLDDISEEMANSVSFTCSFISTHQGIAKTINALKPFPADPAIQTNVLSAYEEHSAESYGPSGNNTSSDFSGLIGVLTSCTQAIVSALNGTATCPDVSVKIYNRDFPTSPPANLTMKVSDNLSVLNGLLMLPAFKESIITKLGNATATAIIPGGSKKLVLSIVADPDDIFSLDTMFDYDFGSKGSALGKVTTASLYRTACGSSSRVGLIHLLIHAVPKFKVSDKDVTIFSF